MAVDITELVPRLKASLTVPGSVSLFTFTTATDPDWAVALLNAFWNARLAGFFTDFRADIDDLEIVNIAGGDDLPEEVHQIIVEQAALNAIETLFAGLANTKSKAGDLEFEQDRSATLLNNLLNGKRALLEKIKEDLLNTGPASTSVAFLDLALVRHSQICQGNSYWMR